MSRLVLLLLITLTAQRVIGDDMPEAEIHSLIHAVSESGCEFNRNGEMHSAAEAAAHLELKYRRGRRYAGSAEEFIERLASKSSWSGEAYLMICDGEAQPAGDWLTATLEALRSQ